ncbi:MAG TPA: phosphoribosyltransferase family protein [Thermoanaerobaculia bacterium]
MSAVEKWIHPFRDLASAGRELAVVLEPYRDAPNTIVLGITRGGVPAAIAVAGHLRLPLDLVVRRGLLVTPAGEGIGATTVAGTLVVDPRLPAANDPPVEPRDHFLLEGFAELHERTLLCRGDKPAVNVAGMNVIVVDNGLRTGGTMRVAVRSARTLGASRIIAAAPVGTPESRASVEEVADETICVKWVPMGNVAMGYARFDVPVNEAIAPLLANRHR